MLRTVLVCEGLMVAAISMRVVAERWAPLVARRLRRNTP
jgi:hypothetical protein